VLLDYHETPQVVSFWSFVCVSHHIETVPVFDISFKCTYGLWLTVLKTFELKRKQKCIMQNISSHHGAPNLYDFSVEQKETQSHTLFSLFIYQNHNV